MQLTVSNEFVAVPQPHGGYTLVRVLPATPAAQPAPARGRVQAIIKAWSRHRYLTPALLAAKAGNSEQAAYQALRYAEQLGVVRRTPRRGWRLR